MNIIFEIWWGNGNCAKYPFLLTIAAGIPQGGGGACGGGGEVAVWLGKGLVGDLGGAAGGLGRRQHHALVAARLVTGGVSVSVCGVDWS